MQSFEEILLDIKKTKTEYEKLCNLQSFQEILLDKKLFLNIKKQTEIIKPLIDSYESFLEEKENFDIVTTLLNNNESDKKINEEFLTTQNKLNDCEEKLKKTYYLLKGSLENISIEIVENKGEISNKLCEILLQGYCNFCKQNCFNFKVINQDVGANINISGYGVKGYFEDEIGLQNVVLGTKSGSCCVFMYKSINNQSFNFGEEELKITTCRSSGAGGQHINTTDSSIKIVHLPTGITAVSQDERSQLQNKQKALERLKKKVTDFLENKNKNEIAKQKKEQLKLMKMAVKTYNLETEQVLILKQKKQIPLSNFLNGKALN